MTFNALPGERLPFVGDRLVPAVKSLMDAFDISRSNAERKIARGDIRVIRVGRLLKTYESTVRAAVADAEARTDARAAA